MGLSIQKLNTLPTTYIKDTIYLIEENGKVGVYISSNDGSEVLSLNCVIDIIVESKLQTLFDQHGIM